MRQFIVSQAPVSRVAQHVRDAVEDGGGIVAHHTSRTTEFDHLDFGEQTWRRAGYVGTYQRFKEKPVEVRIRVWAQWPRRLLAGSIYLGFFVAFLFFLASLIEITFPPNVWIFTALPILAVIATAFLMYTSSISDSEVAEQRIASDLVERLTEDEQVPGQVYDLEDWEDYRETIIEEAREDARRATPHGGSRIRRVMADLGGSVPSIGSDVDEEPETAPAEAEESEPRSEADEEPVEAGADEADEPGPLQGLKTTLGLGSEDAESDEATKTTEETSEQDGALAGLKTKLGLGSDDEATDDEETDVEETDEADEASQQEGVLERLKAKLGLGSEDEETAEEESDVDPAEAATDTSATTDEPAEPASS